jgi:site-specific DNA recombinase
MSKRTLDEDIEMNNPTPEEYAAVYARKSTKLENNSLSSQAALARQEIQKRNLFLYDIYEDEESATKFHPMHRPGFKRLIYDAEQGKFKNLIVFRRDRLARRVEDLIEIKKFFKKYGVKIIYSNQGEYQYDENNYLSSFIENIIISVDELEPTILSERIAAGKQEKRKRGEYASKVPYGYKSIKDASSNRLIVQDENKAKVVKAIFEGFLEEVNNEADLEKLIRQLSETYKNEVNINYTEVSRILLRPLYGGLILLNPENHKSETSKCDKNDDYHVDKGSYVKCVEIQEPIVESEKWYASLAKWKKIIMKDDVIEDEVKEDYIFKGKLKCKKCKEPIFLMKNTHNFRCAKGCTIIEESQLDEFLLNKIITHIINNANLEDIYQKKLKQINNKISIMQEDIDRFKSLENNTMYNLLQCFSQDGKTNYKDLIIYIDQELEKTKEIDKYKEKSVKMKNIIERLYNIQNLEDSNISISILKNKPDLTMEIVNSLVKEIQIRCNKDVNINDAGNCSFKYKYE